VQYISATRNAGFSAEMRLVAKRSMVLKNSQLNHSVAILGDALGQLLPACRAWGILPLCTFSDRDFMGLFQRHRSFVHESAMHFYDKPVTQPSEGQCLAAELPT
jgi:hypothetical protein